MNEISPIDFYKLYLSTFKIKIIDVRETYEFDEYHIKGSVNIPFSVIMNKHSLFLNKKYHYFIICKNGTASKIVTNKLHDLGYNICNVIGGLKSWRGDLVQEVSFY